MSTAVLTFLGGSRAHCEPCITASQIDGYIQRVRPSSPLRDKGCVFVESGAKWKVDPRLMVAISGAETGFGADGSSCTQYNNPFNWFYCYCVTCPGVTACVESDPPSVKCSRSSYATWDEAITGVTRFIKKSYLDQLKKPTIENFALRYVCGPNASSTDPCDGYSEWKNNVRSIIGPSPAGLDGDPERLGFTCKADCGTGPAPTCPGNALQFDGGNDEVVIPHSTSLSFDPGEQITVELWFKLTQPAYVYHLLGKRANCGIPAERNYQIAVSGSELAWGSGNIYAFTSISLSLNQWMHVAGSFDGAFFHLYVNGERKDSRVGFPNEQNTAPLKIGGSADCAHFPGVIDEVRVWNVARTDQDIAQNFTRTVDPNSAGLVGYWNFDEATGVTVDRSGHTNNDGTLIGGPQRVASDAPTCGPKYFAPTGHYYQLVRGLQSTCWTDANQVATAAGGYLASVRSFEENKFILDLMPADALAYSGIFIGGQAPDGQGADPSKYSWTSGEPWDYSRWSLGEPNYPQEDKLEIFYDLTRRGYWNNSENCITGWDIYYVIEHNSNPSAKPTASPDETIESAVPQSPSLAPNYPNPFNAATVIGYTLRDHAHVKLEVFDILGRRVATLIDANQGAGNHQLTWNGTDWQGRSLASGMYFYRLTTSQGQVTRKMVLLK